MIPFIDVIKKRLSRNKDLLRRFFEVAEAQEINKNSILEHQQEKRHITI